MNKLTTTLLTGAAMGALSLAPAMAGQSLHPMLAVKTAHGVITVKGMQQFKTTVTPGRTKHTYTLANYTVTEPISTWYKQVKDLPGEVWYAVSSGGHCVDYPGQKAKAIKDPKSKTKVYTAKSHVTLSTCTGTLTFYGPAYELKDVNATTDHVQFNDVIKFTTTTTSTGGKAHKHKYTDTSRENFNFKFD